MLIVLWRRGVVVITTAQLYSTKPVLRFCAGSNPARGVLEIRDGEDLWQWSRLEIRLNAFRRSTIPQKQFIIIIIDTQNHLVFPPNLVVYQLGIDTFKLDFCGGWDTIQDIQDSVQTLAILVRGIIFSMFVPLLV